VSGETNLDKINMDNQQTACTDLGRWGETKMKIAICGEGWVNRVGSAAIGIFHIVHGMEYITLKTSARGRAAELKLTFIYWVN